MGPLDAGPFGHDSGLFQIKAKLLKGQGCPNRHPPGPGWLVAVLPGPSPGKPAAGRAGLPGGWRNPVLAQVCRD